MNKDIKITIIVPVYNTPIRLMNDFFESIKKQSNQDFFVYVVDDGSEDECKKFLNGIAEKMKNVTVIYNDHQGVSHARNTGIAKTTTMYLSFADSDDIVSDDFIQGAYDYINKYNPDVIYGTMKYYPNDSNIKQCADEVEVFDNNNKNELKKALLNIMPRAKDYQILGSTATRIYNTKLAKSIMFNEEISIFEDQIFNRKIINTAKKALVVPNVWYSYLQYEESSIHKGFYKGFYNSSIPYLSQSNIIDKTENDEIRNGMRLNYIRLLYASINHDLLEKKEKSNVAKKRIIEMMNNDVISDAVFNINLNSLNIIDIVNVLLLRQGIIKPLILEKKLLLFFRNHILNK